jgi:glycosyltransferase involved in cell wall biosynthesis
LSTRVAILQNQFRLGGRTRVLCEVIDLLNEMGITPNLLTFTPPAIGHEAALKLGYKNLQLNYRHIAPVTFARGWLWQILLINLLTRRQQVNYDFVFNSNNTLYGLHPDGCYLHYIYYPVATNRTDLREFQEYNRSLPRFLYGYLLGSLLRLTGQSAPKNLYTISEFSRDAVIRAYPEADFVKIIYPPSVYAPVNGEESGRMVRCVSTGSIVPDKRQLDQIAIAKQLPHLEFWIVGAIKSKVYYQKCQDAIERDGLTNVQIKPDMSYDALQNLLSTSTYFLHTKHDEHFGISTVEAIAAGCIPVTHDSGGQREVVPDERLRFQTVEEAVAILQSLQGGDLTRQRTELQAHIQQFSREHFRAGMREAFKPFLTF